MPRIQLPVYQNALPNGGVNSSGYLYFYENRSDPPSFKNVFIDPDELVPSVNPVPLDSDGYTPNLFGRGAYTVVCKDQHGVQLWSRDDVVVGTSGGQFADYSPIQPYEKNAIVRAENGQYYVSLFNQNTNHEPSISPEWWSRTVVLKYWNANEIYADGETVLHLGSIWISTEADNEGNEPKVGSNFWAATFSGMVNPMTTAGDIIVGAADGAATRLGIGTAGQGVMSNGTAVSWGDPVGGRVVTDADDVTGAKLVNVSWMQARGMGDLPLSTEISLDQLFGEGSRCFFVEDADDGPSADFTGYVEVIEYDDGNAIQRVTDAATGAVYVRVVINDVYGGWASLSSGSGDVTGPGSSTNNNLVTFNGTTGKIIKDSGVAISSAATGDTVVQRNGSGGIAVAGVTCSSVTSSGGISAYSDPKLKQNFVKIENALARLDHLNGWFYQWISDPEKMQAGLNAQEIQNVFPEAVSLCDDTMSVSIMSMLGLVVSAINELKEEVRK